MLTFLNRIFLPFLAAAVIPILIHLLMRRKLVRQSWPSLKFLSEIQKRRMRRFKIKQILLLILRVLILLLVIGAFARPAIRGVFAGGVGAHEKTSVAILVDRSYSMGQEAAGVDLLTQAKMVAGEILQLLGEGDELTIVPFDETPAPVFNEPTRFLMGAHDLIDSISLSDNKTDCRAALMSAIQIQEKSRLLHKEIYILTDNKAIGWEREGEFDIPERTRVYAIPFKPDDERNIGITQIEFPRTLLQVKTPFELSAQISSFAPGAVENHLVDLFLDQERVAQKSVDLSPGSARPVNMTLEVENGGYHHGHFKLEGDALATDNDRYFSFKIPKLLEVLIVGGGETNFIKKALSPNPDGFFITESTNYNRLGGKLLSNYDVIVLSDPPVLPNVASNAITGFARRGGGILVLFGGSEDPEAAYNQIFGDMLTAEILASVGDPSGMTRLGLGNCDTDHPVFSPYAEKGLPQVNFKRVAAIENSDAVLLELSNGLPAICEAKLGEGAVALGAFSANLRYSDIATSGFMVPLMQRLVQYLANEEALFDPGYLVGQEAIRTLDRFPASTQSLKLVYPNGFSRFISPRFSLGKAIINTGVLQESGIYRIYADSTLLDLFAVNVNTVESDPRPLEKDILAKNINVKTLSPDANLTEEILSARHGKEIHHGMLILAFMLMLAELALGSSWKPPEDLSGKISSRESL